MNDNWGTVVVLIERIVWSALALGLVARALGLQANVLRARRVVRLQPDFRRNGPRDNALALVLILIRFALGVGGVLLALGLLSATALLPATPEALVRSLIYGAILLTLEALGLWAVWQVGRRLARLQRGG